LRAQQTHKYAGWAEEWLDTGMKKIVVKVQDEKELLDLFEQVKGKFPTALIQDAGRTQVDAGTKTCIGIGPAPEGELHKFTGKLKLL
jgi:PTH2 family peptidyl-tRNA hydrolase